MRFSNATIRSSTVRISTTRSTFFLGTRRNCSSHCKSVSTVLFLGDSPSLAIPILQGEIPINQFWPLDPRFNFHKPIPAIQIEHSTHLSDINQQGIRATLLPSHGVPPTRN